MSCITSVNVQSANLPHKLRTNESRILFGKYESFSNGKKQKVRWDLASKKPQDDDEKSNSNSFTYHGSFLDLFGVMETEKDGNSAEIGVSSALEVEQPSVAESAREIGPSELGNEQFSEDDDWNSSSLNSQWMAPENSDKVGTKKWGDDDEDINKRFKLRNGKEIFEERTYLMGVGTKNQEETLFSVDESLEELSQLAETAGLVVVGSSSQKLSHPNPKTYIGPGKVEELKAAVRGFGAETVVFDDELSPAQLRNLERALGDEVRVCDRTALILDIFQQRAATKEATLQVELAQTEYQLPRLTRLWTHLERQAGGLVKGMGEKQIEVDKRILRTKISFLKKTLESVRGHRKLYRRRRAAAPIPVASLVGYTNAGKSTILNRLTNAGVLAEDKLFATLDPTTRRVHLPGGKEILFSDTVGFIQKLPTQLVAAFRATLEEIQDSSLLIHVVDISHPMVEQQIQTVDSVLEELDLGNIDILTVWNKMDRAANPRALARLAQQRKKKTVCISALSGEGMEDLYLAVEDAMKDMMVFSEAVIPYTEGDLLSFIHRTGIVLDEEYLEEGTLVRAKVPASLCGQLAKYAPSKDDAFPTKFDLDFEFDISKIPGQERIIEIDS